MGTALLTPRVSASPTRPYPDRITQKVYSLILIITLEYFYIYIQK